jgi:hypothetical protein
MCASQSTISHVGILFDEQRNRTGSILIKTKPEPYSIKEAIGEKDNSKNKERVITLFRSRPTTSYRASIVV